jgi:organic hydroperoxide reductase OsmC/OhrA
MTKPAAFPHRYSVALEDRRLSAPPRMSIAVGPPPQFGGSDEVWSPEELLVGATLECLWTTFEAYARRDKLAFAGWSGTGVGVLDKGPTGPVFTSITLSVELEVAAGDVERAQRLLTTAEHHCIISNALRVAVAVQATIRPVAPA